jgi:hypothetical protein
MWIHEIFQKICKEEDRDKRIEMLKENDNFVTRTFLALAYNDKIKLAIPEGKPPAFVPRSTEQKIPSPLISEYVPVLTPIKNCVTTNKSTQYQKEKIFTDIVNKVHPEDALILIAIKDGKLLTFKRKKYSKITKSLVEVALPNVIK